MEREKGDRAMYFDSHCHLNDEKLFPFAESLVREAENAGLAGMICIGYDAEANRRALELATRYASVYAAVGFHPEAAHQVQAGDWVEWEEMLKHPKVVAIGECGLDYYWEKTHIDEQKAVFRRQLIIAAQRGMPVVVHMREATEDTRIILSEPRERTLSGVMHCYSGSVESMRDFLNLGMHISLAGPVTFKNARQPKEVAVAVPEGRLLIETDSPYLAPVPFRGKDNQPAFLPYVCKTIAELRGTPVEALAKITTANAERLFGIR